jgi:hypothetical protein
VVTSQLLRIASRGSRLALWQARAVRDAVLAASPGTAVEIEVVRTTGDRILDVPLAKIGDKGLFTRELDAALLAGSADLAVHSLKDIPTRVPDGLEIAAVSRREDPRDVLVFPPGRWPISPPARAWAPARCAAAPSSARCGRTSPCWTCAATSTPAWTSWTGGIMTPSSSPPPA